MADLDAEFRDAKTVLDGLYEAEDWDLAVEFMCSFLSALRLGETVEQAVAFALNEWDI